MLLLLLITYMYHFWLFEITTFLLTNDLVLSVKYIGNNVFNRNWPAAFENKKPCNAVLGIATIRLGRFWVFFAKGKEVWV